MKWHNWNYRKCVKRSPSSRGRGLKCRLANTAKLSKWSPSSRGRGLKYQLKDYDTKVKSVALFTRAWIEIPPQATKTHNNKSPSSRGRGLKFTDGYLLHADYESPSSRGRGLKWLANSRYCRIIESPSSRGRGLKYRCCFTWTCCNCRPLHEGVD